MTLTDQPSSSVLASTDIDVLMPVFNDWSAVQVLLPALDRALSAHALTARVILVDDGSTATAPDEIRTENHAIRAVDVLALKRNLGHQRAIAVGLAWASEHTTSAAVVVMDGDGQDDPADVPMLVARARVADAIVFAERTRRSESVAFKICYDAYRACHYLITGIPVRVGNFSVIPRRFVSRLAVVSELWNHYAAGVFKAQFPRDSMPTTRAERVSGQSRMNFVNLVVHGLSAVSVHSEIASVRLLVAAGMAAVLAAAVGSALVAIRLFTSWSVPTWAGLVAAGLAVLLVQLAGLSVSMVFLMLANRSGASYIPLRDYPYFVAECRSVPVVKTSPA